MTIALDKEVMKQETLDIQRLTKFTVCVVWTNDPGRVLSEPKDLTYLAVFNNTVIAEVSRLDLEADDRAKGDFISLISHELPSPLHGVLGTVDLLRELVDTYAQRSLVETVYSCSPTLSRLLNYAKINTLTHPDDRKQNGAAKSRPDGAVSGSRQDEDLSVLVQEVFEGLLAGVHYKRNGPDGNNAGTTSGLESRLLTIVDIKWKDSWLFSVHAGA